MMIHKLGQELRKLYDTPGMNKVAMIHLFGIYYAVEMERNNIKPIDVVKAANLPESYKTEVSKGMKLAPFVTIDSRYKHLFD